jgi:Arylsulfotransferase (ASST)
VLQGAGGAAALVAAAGLGVGELLHKRPSKPLPEINSFAGDARSFHSRPDLRPPTITATAGTGADPLDSRGLLFLGPGPVSLSGSEQYGPLIVNRAGTPVWFRPLAKGLQVTNFTTTQYRGEPVLVWWQGKILQSGYGQGEAVLLDHNYREIARVQAANGRSMDLHGLTVTPQGTALFTCYPETTDMDLSTMGGPISNPVLGSIIQEVDIASGRLLLEWRGLEHIPVTASYEPMSAPYDYLHVNSIEPLADGNLLVSARHTWAVYKLERRTGAVMWTLGGKRSQLEMGPGAQFAWQHDARLPSDSLLTVFDNGTNGPTKTESESRGLVLNVDEARRRVTVRNAYLSPEKLSAGAMGSVQILSPERVLVGWGVQSHTIEFATDGPLLVDIALPAGTYSYRGLWLPWMGTPEHQPALAAERNRKTGITTVYASWNGATDVASWQVAAGVKHNHLKPLGIARRQGFETVIPLHRELRYASVTALDRHGRRLRRSAVIQL